MRIRMGYALEFIGVLAFAMALSRWSFYFVDPLSSAILPSQDGIRAGFRLVDSFLYGAVLAGVVGLWIEAARGRSLRPWGAGRRGWSLLALVYLLRLGGRLSLNLGLLRSADSLSLLMIYLGRELDYLITNIDFDPACILVAVALTSRMAGTARGPAADTREWAGRALLAAIVVEESAFCLVMAIRYW